MIMMIITMIMNNIDHSQRIAFHVCFRVCLVQKIIKNYICCVQ